MEKPLISVSPPPKNTSDTKPKVLEVVIEDKFV